MSRRQLISLVAVVAALLIAGTDAWAVHHFGTNAATKRYPDDYLNAVACPSAAQCWAVGQTASAPGGNTLSEPRNPLLKHETAGRWRTVAAAGAGAKGARSRPSRAQAPRTAGPSAATRRTRPAVIEHWTGGAWQLAPSPGRARRQLDAISCASASACWATGGTQARSGATADLLEQWNGVPVGVATSVAGGLRPQQFSCPGAGYCLALGVRGRRASAAAVLLRRSLDRGRAARPGRPAPPGRSPHCSAAPARPCAWRRSAESSLVTDVWNGQGLDARDHQHADLPGRPDLLRRPGLLAARHDPQVPPAGAALAGEQLGRCDRAAGPPPGYLTALACGSSCWAVGGEGGTRRNGNPYTRPLIAPLG